MVNFAVAAVSPLLLHLYLLKLINIIPKTVCCFAEVAIINFFQKKGFLPSQTKMSTRGNLAKNNETRFFYVLL